MVTARVGVPEAVEHVAPLWRPSSRLRVWSSRRLSVLGSVAGASTNPSCTQGYVWIVTYTCRAQMERISNEEGGIQSLNCVLKMLQSLEEVRKLFDRHLPESCGRIMLDVCIVLSSYVEYIAMVKTANECQLRAYMILHGKFSTVVCCAEVMWQPIFSLMWLTRRQRSCGTLHRLSAYAQELLISRHRISGQPSASVKRKSPLSTTSMYWLCSICVIFAHVSCGLLHVDPRQCTWRPLMSCLRGCSTSRKKRASTTETELSGTRVGGSPIVYPAVNLTKQYTLHVSWSHRHAHSWQAEVFHGSNHGKDNVRVFFWCCASEDERSLLPCYNSDMTAELLSLSM